MTAFKFTKAKTEAMNDSVDQMQKTLQHLRKTIRRMHYTDIAGDVEVLRAQIFDLWMVLRVTEPKADRSFGQR